MFWVLESLELIFALLWREKNCREDFEYKYVCNYCVQSLWRKGFLRADLCAFTLYLSSNKSFSLILSVWNFHSTFPGVGLTGVHFHLQQRAVPLLSFYSLFAQCLSIVNCGCQNPQSALSLPLDSVTLLTWLPRNWLSESWKHLRMPSKS